MNLNCTCFRVRKLSRQITQLYDDALRPTGLRITQYSMLSAIRDHSPLSVAALAEGLGADPTSVSRALRPVIAKGWVLLSDGTDGRSKLVLLTEEGRRKLIEADSHWRGAERAVSRLLPGDLKAVFNDSLDEIGTRIGREDSANL